MFDRVFGKKIIGFKENSITQFISLALRGDKAILLLLLISINTLSFSQELIEVNTVREGYYKIFNADSIQIDRKATELEAMQGLINYQFRSGKIGYYLPPNFRVDIRGNSTVEQIQIDTLTISGSWHLTGENGNYFRYPDCGDIIKIKADTVLKWQNDIHVIRTKTFGETILKLTDSIPFQIRDLYFSDTTDTSIRVNVNITEKQSEILGYLDSILVKEFYPGSSHRVGENNYSFYFLLRDLEKGKSYIFQLEVKDINGNLNISNEIKVTI